VKSLFCFFRFYDPSSEGSRRSGLRLSSSANYCPGVRLVFASWRLAAQESVFLLPAPRKISPPLHNCDDSVGRRHVMVSVPAHPAYFRFAPGLFPAAFFADEGPHTTNDLQPNNSLSGPVTLPKPPAIQSSRRNFERGVAFCLHSSVFRDPQKP